MRGFGLGLGLGLGSSRLEQATEGGRGWAPGSREKQGETGQAAGAAKIISHAASAILAYLRGLVAKENVGAWTQRAKHRTSTRRAAKESRGPGVRREEAPPAYVAPEGGRERGGGEPLPYPQPHPPSLGVMGVIEISNSASVKRNTVRA